MAQAVETWILDDKLLSGVLLGTRRDLGDRLGVAPSTVSEAIKLLEDRGRVVTKTGPGGGVFVAEPRVGIRLARSMMSVSGSEGEGEVAQALEVRNILEPAVILDAAETRHTTSEVEGMRRAMQAMRVAEDTTDFFRRNLDFHAEVARLGTNKMLRSIYCGLLEVVQSHDPMLALLPNQNRRALHARRIKVHQDISDAIEQGDLAAARTAARAHGRQAVRTRGGFG